MAPSSEKSTPAASSAGRYRFVPIEANTAFTSPHRPPPKTQPPPGPPGYGYYPPPPPGHAPPPVHYNPQGAAHPYFFPPVLAHQPGAHFQSPYPPQPPPQPSHGPASPTATPPALAPAAPPDASSSTPSTTPAPAKRKNNAANKDLTPVNTTASHILERAKTAASQTPNPATNTNSTVSNVNINPRYPPKGQNTAARPLTHPNPEALGLTRISPPPESRYPSSDLVHTVVTAWAKSRGFRLSRQKSDKNAAGDMYKQYYLCTRHGRPTNTHKVTPETRQRKQRKSERIGCPMGLVVRAVEASNPVGDWTVRWQLEGKSEWHNHGPATEEELAEEKDRAEKNERRKASRGVGNGKRGRRLKDPSKPARKRDRRKKKPEQESGDGSNETATAPTATATDGINTNENTITNEAQLGTLLQQSNEQHLQHGHEQEMDHGHAQQLQQELTSSLQRHDLSALNQSQLQRQHQHQIQHSQPQHSQSQHRSRTQNSHMQPQTSHQRVQAPQQQTYATQALPNLWGLDNTNLLTQHQQQQNQQNQQQQQQQAYRNYGYAQPGPGGGGSGGLGYR